MIIELKKINRRKISNELAKDLREICKVLFKLLFFLLILFLLNETSGFTVNRFTVFSKGSITVKLNSGGTVLDKNVLKRMEGQQKKSFEAARRE